MNKIYWQQLQEEKNETKLFIPKKVVRLFFHTYIGLILCIFRSYHHHFLMFDYWILLVVVIGVCVWPWHFMLFDRVLRKFASHHCWFHLVYFIDGDGGGGGPWQGSIDCFAFDCLDQWHWIFRMDKQTDRQTVVSVFFISFRVITE